MRKNKNTGNQFEIVYPPCVPYELLVVWQKKNVPVEKSVKKGYDNMKKRNFEETMAGNAPLPDMPKVIINNTKGANLSKVMSSTSNKRQKNLLSVFK